MGGCRCTYRNCSLRTDGKTHMFHYPVFDKVRCHQWLTNAHKLEFLNLKVSQLKNRVVCQHHFKDENFMNFRKDKLTFDAVPTEDGPYCDTSQLQNSKIEQDDTKVYSISLDDIENEYLTLIDKKESFSVKYGDFLTNCDLMDLDSLNQINTNTQTPVKGLPVLDPCNQETKALVLPSGPVRSITHINRDKTFEESSNIILNDSFDRINTTMKGNPNYHSKIQTSIPNQTQNPITVKNTPQDKEDQNEMNVMYNISLVPVEYDEKKRLEQQQQTTDQSFAVKPLEEQKPQNEHVNRSLLKERNKIRIISEKKISEPVPFIGKLEPVSPTRVLSLPNRINYVNLHPVENSLELSTNSIMGNTIELPDTLKNNIVLEEQKIEPPKIINNDGKKINSQKIRVNVRNNEVSPKTSLIRSKIPPERVAAIAEKRKFNMKLRDIIEDCLDKLDDPNKSDYDSRKLSNEPRTMQSKQQQVSSHLANEPELPNIHEYTVAYLEARMKRMESNLINKIDQNSQRIVEIRQSFAPSCDKKTVYTQTSVNEDLHKRQLYREISQYLSGEANSLIYEELFINKYSQHLPKCSPSTKRRKFRR